MIWQMEANRD